MQKIKNILLSPNIRQFFVAAFILTTGLLFLWSSSTRPSILVIHTYSATTPWVKGINHGLRSIFSKRTFYHVYYHYMDFQGLHNEQKEKKSTKEALNTIESIKPKYLILVGDFTQEKIGTKYINHDHIDIIYCGIKRPQSDYGYDVAKNTTGVQIALPLDILNELFDFNRQKNVFDNQVKLTFLGDMSTLSTEDRETLKKYNGWEKVKLHSVFNVLTFQDWKKRVRETKGHNDILLLSNYRTLLHSEERRTFVNPKDVIEWTVKNAHVPLIGLYNFFVLDGGALSIAPSPFEIGEETARIVESLIEKDVYTNTIDLQNSKHFFIYMRAPVEGKPHKLKTPLLYEIFSKSMNNYYK